MTFKNEWKIHFLIGHSQWVPCCPVSLLKRHCVRKGFVVSWGALTVVGISLKQNLWQAAAKKRVDLFSVSVRVALAHYLSKSRRSQPNTHNKHFFLILYFMLYPTLSPFLGIIQFWRILFRKVLLASIKQWIPNYDRNKIKEEDEEIKKSDTERDEEKKKIDKSDISRSRKKIPVERQRLWRRRLNQSTEDGEGFLRNEIKRGWFTTLQYTEGWEFITHRAKEKQKE